MAAVAVTEPSREAATATRPTEAGIQRTQLPPKPEASPVLERHLLDSQKMAAAALWVLQWPAMWAAMVAGLDEVMGAAVAPVRAEPCNAWDPRAVLARGFLGS